MEKTVQAIFENGVLHPLAPLPLKEQQQVTLTVSDGPENAAGDAILVSSDEWADGAKDEISLDEVRRRLSTIRGSLSQAIIDERLER